MKLQLGSCSAAFSSALGSLKVLTRLRFCILTLTLLLTAGSIYVAQAQPRTVRVGIYQNKPKIFLDENGKASGLFVEILEAIAAQEGWTLEYVPCEWEACLRALEGGQIDLMPDVAYSAERDAKFDFHSIAVLESWSRVYSSPGASIESLPDVDGKRIAVLKESIQQTVFEQLVKSLGYQVTLVPAASLEEAFEITRNGLADAAIANHLFGDYYYQDYGLRRTTIDFNPVTLYYVTANGRNADLLEAIDRYLGKWIPNKSSPYYEMLGHWSNTKTIYRLPPYVAWTMVGVLVISVAATGAAALFRKQVRLRTMHLEQASAALRESERRYQTLANISPVGIFRTDSSGATTYVNPKWSEISGLTFDQALGDGWLAAVHPDDRDALRQGWQEAAMQHSPSHAEYRFVRPDGTTAWVIGQAVPEVNAENEIAGYVGTITDITARKRTEEELRISEARLMKAQQIARLGFLDWDLTTNSFFFSDEIYRMVGINRDVTWITPELILDTVHPEDRNLVQQRLSDAIKGASEYDLDHRIVRADGAIRWIHGQIEIVRDASGHPVQLLGIAHDITDRKQVEDELRRRAEEFASLYEIAHEVTAQSNLAVLLETITQQTARLLRTSDATIYLYDPARNELELAAANVYAFPRGMRFPVGKGVSSEVVRERRPIIIEDYRTWANRRPELEHLDLRSVAMAPLIHRQEIIGALGVSEMGSDRKFTGADLRLLELIAVQAAVAIQNARLREEMEKYNKELEERVAERTEQLSDALLRAQEADRVKSAFLATMSHELRTPLNSIIGFTGVLLQGLAGPLNAEQEKQLGMTRDSARHLLALINDVLDISKIEAGQLRVERAPFAMRDAIESALRAVSQQAQKKGLALTVGIASGVGVLVSDRRRVEQILLNLLSNAIKFTERGEVRLECRVREKWLETSVHDTGIGIRSEDMDRLFKPFQQLETGLNRRHEGTGLGLAICGNLVKLLGGEIHAASEWGKGSTFTFTLPLAGEE